MSTSQSPIPKNRASYILANVRAAFERLHASGTGRSLGVRPSTVAKDCPDPQVRPYVEEAISRLVDVGMVVSPNGHQTKNPPNYRLADHLMPPLENVRDGTHEDWDGTYEDVDNAPAPETKPSVKPAVLATPALPFPLEIWQETLAQFDALCTEQRAIDKRKRELRDDLLTLFKAGATDEPGSLKLDVRERPASTVSVWDLRQALKKVLGSAQRAMIETVLPIKQQHDVKVVPAEDDADISAVATWPAQSYDSTPNRPGAVLWFSEPTEEDAEE